MRAARLRLSLALAAAAAATGCARSDRALDAARPIELEIPASPATLDPRFATDAYAVRATRLVHAGLVRVDPETLAPQPYLARAWQLLDARTVQFDLREDVRFHSGAPFGARDVCATLSALAAPALASPQRALAQGFVHCEEVTPHRVRLGLAAPTATWLTDLELPVLRADEAGAPPRPDGSLDGLGPYVVARADDAAVELSPATAGALPRPAHALTLRTVKDENARALRLLAGRADVAANALSPTLLPAVEGHAGLEVHARPGANVTYLLLHDEHAPFDRAEARRAVAGALDRELLARALFSGHATPAACIFPRGTAACPAHLVPPPFDPVAARAVLAASSRPMQLLCSTDRLRSTVARALAQQLRDAGLDVEAVPLDLGVMLARLTRGDFDLAVLQMPELTEPDLLRWFFHSRGIPEVGKPTAGANRARFRDAEVDAWLDAAHHASDAGERAALYARVAEAMRAEMPVVPLWHEDQVAVVSPRARAFAPSADGRWLGLAELP